MPRRRKSYDYDYVLHGGPSPKCLKWRHRKMYLQQRTPTLRRQRRIARIDGKMRKHCH